MGAELLVTDETSGTPEAPKLTRYSFSVSDLHLSAGRTIEVRLRTTLRYKVRRAVHGLFRQPPPAATVEIPNPLEDFHHDHDYLPFLKKNVELAGAADIIDHKCKGDVLDPLAVTFEGRFGVPMTEAVAIYKLKRIRRGHQPFFAAQRWYLHAHENTWLTWFTGNHDQFLDFPAVQRRLVRWLATNDDGEFVPSVAARIRFIDYTHKYRLVEDGFWYDHGMNAEPHTALDPENPFITERFGKKLRRPELNQPIGNIMVEQISNPAKLGNASVGRLPDWDTWWEAVVHGRYLWGLKLGWILLLFIFMSKHKVSSIVQTVLATAKQRDPVKNYGLRILRENPDIRGIDVGHDHIAARVTETVRALDGTTEVVKTYLNSGTWSARLMLVWPKLEYSWSRLRWLEKAWRALRHYAYSHKTPLGRRGAWVVLAAYLVSLTALVIFLQTSFVGVWAYSILWLKALGIVTLLFLALKGFTHFFLVKPTIVKVPLLTSSLVRRYADDALLADVMVYEPVEQTLRELV